MVGKKIMNKLRIQFILLLLSILLAFNQTCLANSNSNLLPLRIAVASNFTPILEKLLPQFHAETSIKTQIMSSGTGTLFLQIKHGAPFDIFIAADSSRPKQLEKESLIVSNSRKTYALGVLALYSANKKLSLNTLNKAPEHFAIANPKIAPYGKAAKETLQHMGLWNNYQKSLVKGVNVNQTFAQIRSKSVDSGLVANSQLVINNLMGTVIPSDFHKPITQQLVIIKTSKNIKHAKQLSDFLLSEKTQQQIVNFGYKSSRLNNG